MLAEGLPEGQWITGGGWNEEHWGGELPSAAWLDPFTPRNPVYLVRMDCHSALANRAALAAAGIAAGTPDPEDGHIVVGRGGVPTGMLM